MTGKNAGVRFQPLRLGYAWTYENDWLYSLKAMLLEAKKDARLEPAATYTG